MMVRLMKEMGEMILGIRDIRKIKHKAIMGNKKNKRILNRLFFTDSF